MLTHSIGAFPLLPLCGSSRCICPPSDVQPSARQSATFCRSVCVTKWGKRSSLAPLPHMRNRTSVDVILRLSCSRYVPQRCRGDHWSSENKRLALSPWIPPMQYYRCRAGACSCRKQAFCTFSTATAFLQTHLSTLRLLFRFFAKKTEPKNASTVFRYAETGECLRTPGAQSPPQALPGFRCPRHPRGSLRLFAASSV